MSSIKQRRLTLPIHCHQGTHVGEYVPFYFCPRSIMLYVIYCANHPELTYRGGQGPILHLEADLQIVVSWAIANGIPWAFSLSNAGAYYTQFRTGLDHLSELDWSAIAAIDFRSAAVKEAKQAEFLLHRFFPWHLVERIGTLRQDVAQQAANVLREAAYRPRIQILPNWYY